MVPDRVAAELAEGAVRYELSRRVTRLEVEVDLLRSENQRPRRALATVVEAAAGGLDPSPVPPHQPSSEA